MTKWWELLSQPRQVRDPIDIWQHQAGGTRCFLRGWSSNVRQEDKAKKVEILAKIQELDFLTDSDGLSDEGWALRYFLEEKFYKFIEQNSGANVAALIGCLRGMLIRHSSTQWQMAGDANVILGH